MRRLTLAAIVAVLTATSCSGTTTTTTDDVTTTTAALGAAVPSESDTRDTQEAVYLAQFERQSDIAEYNEFLIEYGYATCDMLDMAPSALFESSMEPMGEALAAAEAQGDLAPLADGMSAVLENAERILAVAEDGSLCPEYREEASRVLGAIDEMVDQLLGDLKEGLGLDP